VSLGAEESVWIVRGGAVHPEATRTREGAIEVARRHVKHSGFGYERIVVLDPENPREFETIDVVPNGHRALKHPGSIIVELVPIYEI
jgi:hypothetical protein